MTVFANYNMLAEETISLSFDEISVMENARNSIGLQKIKEKQSAYGAVSRPFAEVYRRTGTTVLLLIARLIVSIYTKYQLSPFSGSKGHAKSVF